MKTSKVLGSLVAACVMLISSQAFATVVSYSDGDIFLGFRATDRTQDYLINIGQPSQFGSSFTFSLNLTDLSTVFGADWFTRIDPNTGTNAVLWGITGGRLVAGGGDVANTLYSSNPNATAWARLSNSAQSGTTSLTDSLGTTYDGNNSTAGTTNAIIQNISQANCWASFQPGGNNSGGISFQQWNPTNEGKPGNVLSIDRIVPGSGPSQLIATISFDENGNVTVTAVPEPSTFVSTIAGAALLIAFLAWRRRSIKA
jgi:hypothetical protein